MCNSQKINALLLASGRGTRLMPLTSDWPKCLMPVQGTPILEHWLSALKSYEIINNIFVNTYYRSEDVNSFLNLKTFDGWVKIISEEQLSGTAGVIYENREIFYDKPLFVAHADNWFDFNLHNFFKMRQYTHSINCAITMLTFDSEEPESVGIVELDLRGRVLAFHEKKKLQSKKLLGTVQANAAVYIFEKDVVNWICDNNSVSDISHDVIPRYLSKIIPCHTLSFFRDLGSLKMLRLAQKDPKHRLLWDNSMYWERIKIFNQKLELISNFQ